jgi:hypothetical protein
LEYAAEGLMCEIDVVLGKAEIESADAQTIKVSGNLAATG